MRVLMILERDFPPDDRVEKEAISLIDAGHQVDLICFTLKGNNGNEHYKQINLFKRKISRFVYRSSVGALRIPFYFNFWNKVLTEHLKANHYDVLHLHDLPLAKTVYLLCKKTSSLFILDLHENYPALLSISPHTKKILGRLLHSDKEWEQYERKYVAKADGLVTVVKEMKERIQPYASAEIAVVENTPLLDELKRYDLKPEENFITLVYSGGVNYHRGLQTVLEGLKLALGQNQKIRLLILGGGSYESLLKAKVKELELENQVIFNGWVTPEKMYEHIYKSDIALIPHIKSVQSDNSSPNKLFQYMYCGKPILASNCNSVERVIRETGTGLTYIYDSPEDFKNKLMQMIAEMPFDKYRLNGPRALQEKYNWGNSVLELISLYKKLERVN